jgi:hypothetical protein
MKADDWMLTLTTAGAQGPQIRKPLRMIILAVLLVAVGAPRSLADTFTPTFLCPSPDDCFSVPTAPNVTFPGPITMEVTWADTLFDFTLPFPEPAERYGWEGVTPGGPAQMGFASFTIFSGLYYSVVSPFVFQLDDHNDCLNCDVTQFGELVFIPAGAPSVPEPSSMVLLLTGIGLAVMRRLAT